MKAKGKIRLCSRKCFRLWRDLWFLKPPHMCVQSVVSVHSAPGQWSLRAPWEARVVAHPPLARDTPHWINHSDASPKERFRDKIWKLLTTCCAWRRTYLKQQTLRNGIQSRIQCAIPCNKSDTVLSSRCLVSQSGSQTRRIPADPASPATDHRKTKWLCNLWTTTRDKSLSQQLRIAVTQSGRFKAISRISEGRPANESRTPSRSTRVTNSLKFSRDQQRYHLKNRDKS